MIHNAVLTVDNILRVPQSAETERNQIVLYSRADTTLADMSLRETETSPETEGHGSSHMFPGRWRNYS